jgi:hypothetical protein
MQARQGAAIKKWWSVLLLVSCQGTNSDRSSKPSACIIIYMRGLENSQTWCRRQCDLQPIWSICHAHRQPTLGFRNDSRAPLPEYESLSILLPAWEALGWIRMSASAKMISMIGCVDVDYRDKRAVAGGIAFRDWLDDNVVAIMSDAMRTPPIAGPQATLSITTIASRPMRCCRTHKIFEGPRSSSMSAVVICTKYLPRQSYCLPAPYVAKQSSVRLLGQ